MLLDGFCSHRFGRKAGKERERGKCPRTYLVVQQLRFHAPNAGDLGSIPGQGARSHRLQLKKQTNKQTNRSHTWCSQNK